MRIHPPFAVLLALAAPLSTQAQSGLLPPPGYYATADPSSAATLRATLHEIGDDHQRVAYSSDLSWQVLELADEHPHDPAAILDVYRNATFPKVGGGTGGYEREHTWPQSYGFPRDSGTGRYPRSDLHALFLSDGGYNASRGATLYRRCGPGCDERPTVANLGRGGGAGTYPGQSNWRQGVLAAGTWETWLGRRGDVARAVFYMDLRYDGSDHADGTDEPDLVLVDELPLIASDGDSNRDPAYFGVRAEILRWHYQDPVDDLERLRHGVVAAVQHNRNPFVDHPEWVACVYQDVCDPAAALLLTDGRFKVTATWRTALPSSGTGQARPLTADTGAFWFFDQANLELVVKVLDACPVNGHFWVFAAGLTNVAVDLHVEDTARHLTRTYTNPLDTPFQPIQDTAAFSTCP